MSFQPTPKQSLFLWNMITAESDEVRSPQMSKAKPQLNATKERKPLIDHGFIEAEKRGRGSFLTLTDKAWAWAAENSDVELMKSNSAIGAQALQGLLRRLLPFLADNDLPLASLFAVRSEPVVDEAVPAEAVPDESDPVSQGGTSANGASVSVHEQIEAACLALANGAKKTRVRLAALRHRLPKITRAALDEALLALSDEERIVLYREDNTPALTDEDHRAALIVGDSPRHLVLLED
jgi:hypothetical protein